MTESSRCAVYARFSSEKQNPLSIDQQIRKCREYADRHNLQVLDKHIYADEAISGDTDNRAALQQLLIATKLKQRPFDVLLVDDTSRLSRRLVDSLHINEQLQFVGVRVIFITQGFDTSSEQAELLVATHGIVDALYLKGTCTGRPDLYRIGYVGFARRCGCYNGAGGQNRTGYARLFRAALYR